MNIFFVYKFVNLAYILFMILKITIINDIYLFRKRFLVILKRDNNIRLRIIKNVFIYFYLQHN